MSKHKIRRNDPCPCGSGKKYKSCCLAKDKAERAERVAWERAAQEMRMALIKFAKQDALVQDLGAALGLFWQDRYTTESIHLMSVDESLRFFDWLAHDYTLSESQQRLVEVYRQEAGDSLSDKEAAVLDDWIAAPPGSAFIIEETDPEQGTVVLQDLMLTDRRLVVQDTPAARHGEQGQILLTRPLPEHDDIRLAGAAVVLPAEEQEGLLAFMAQAREAYLEQRPEATLSRFLRDRAYLMTHYALEWADREDRPAVSADDPEAKKPGGQAVKKLIRWGQERIHIR